MHITKYGHSCILVEEKGVRFLFDPGSYSTRQNSVQNIDAILITHEHQDHLSIESLSAILAGNPGAVIYTNNGVGKKLSEQGIAFTLLEDGQHIEVKGVSVEAFGKDHAVIYSNTPEWRWVNTGYLIAGRLYHPGDALCIPPRPVEILALPVCAPWAKIAEIIDFAKAVGPKHVFPIHDGVLNVTAGFYRWPETFLPPARIEWLVIKDGEVKEF